MYKAVFIDMDGTLLNSQHQVTPPTISIIQQLLRKGILIVPISARPLHGMLPITQQVFPTHIPVVSLNGSYIFSNGNISHQVHLQPAQAQQVEQIIADKPLTAMYYCQNEWFASKDDAAVQKEQKITPVKICIQPFDDSMQYWHRQQTGPNKILIAGHPELILQTEQLLLQQLGSQTNIFKSQPRYVELMHIDASKTSAMQMLMEQYQLAQHEVIAIGDNYNDAAMIAFAGTGVAMGNAPDDIKAIADFVTDTNNNDGVAKALHHFFG
jgi:Cof subfamily protein (haloacid dehalogenase superfamily)